MEFENVTQYDRRAMLALNRAAAGAHRPWLPLLSHGLGYAAGLMFLGGGLRRLSAGQGDGPAVVSVVFGVVLLVWALFLFRIRAWTTAALLTKNNREHRALLGGEGFTVTNSATRTRLAYDRVWRVVETKGYYVLLLDQRHGYVLDKGGFIRGSGEEFVKFLTARMGTPLVRLPLG